MLQDIAVSIASKKVNYNHTPADYEDMRQEAALAIWQHLDKGEKYALSCGINAALKWYRFYVLDWHRNDKIPQPTPQSESIKIAESENGDSLIEKFLATDFDSYILDTEIIESLIELFLAARIKKGQRGLEAATRDARIVAMLCEGYSDIGIAQELGTKTENIKKYRQHIRKVLEKELV